MRKRPSLSLVIGLLTIFVLPLAVVLVGDHIEKNKNSLAKENLQEDRLQVVTALASKYDAASDWSAGLDDGWFYAIELQHALSELKQPIIMELHVEDVYEVGGQPIIWASDFETSHTFYVRLEASIDQVRKLIEHKYDWYDEVAVIEVTSVDWEHPQDEGLSIVVSGRCLDLLLIP